MKYPVPFGRHLLLERINVGGMAEVFKAKSFGVEGFERIVAVKRILPTMAEDDEFVTMFVDEARIASHLTHQNIVQIYELGKFDGNYYISMEYVAGRDLRQILDLHKRTRKPMEVAKACYVTSRVCEALEYAHKKKDPAGRDLKIIHRDVSPQNVIISFEGEVKLCDFGIAKAASRASRTQVGVLKGKFAYMSPEQVRGQSTDRRSDLFALGVIFYEMLTGERLFLGESDYSTLEAVRNARVPVPTQYNAKIPPELEKIMMRLLARDPKDRYQWASEVHEDLLDHCVQDGKIYHGRHLRTWMQESYARDIEIENAKLEEFMRLERPTGLEETSKPVEPPPPSPAPVVLAMAEGASAKPAIDPALGIPTYVAPPREDPEPGEASDVGDATGELEVVPSLSKPKPKKGEEVITDANGESGIRKLRSELESSTMKPEGQSGIPSTASPSPVSNLFGAPSLDVDADKSIDHDEAIVRPAMMRPAGEDKEAPAPVFSADQVDDTFIPPKAMDVPMPEPFARRVSAREPENATLMSEEEEESQGELERTQWDLEAPALGDPGGDANETLFDGAEPSDNGEGNETEALSGEGDLQAEIRAAQSELIDRLDADGVLDGGETVDAGEDSEESVSPFVFDPSEGSVTSSSKVPTLGKSPPAKLPGSGPKPKQKQPGSGPKPTEKKRGPSLPRSPMGAASVSITDAGAMDDKTSVSPAPLSEPTPADAVAPTAISSVAEPKLGFDFDDGTIDAGEAGLAGRPAIAREESERPAERERERERSNGAADRPTSERPRSQAQKSLRPKKSKQNGAHAPVTDPGPSASSTGSAPRPTPAASAQRNRRIWEIRSEESSRHETPPPSDDPDTDEPHLRTPPPVPTISQVITPPETTGPRATPAEEAAFLPPKPQIITSHLTLRDPRVLMLIAAAVGMLALALLVTLLLTRGSSGASLHIVTEPVRAVEVKLDGKVIAHETPVEANSLGLGQHTVELRADGFHPYTQVVQISEAKPHTMVVPLEPADPGSTAPPEKAPVKFNSDTVDRDAREAREAKEARERAQGSSGKGMSGSRVITDLPAHEEPAQPAPKEKLEKPAPVVEKAEHPIEAKAERRIPHPVESEPKVPKADPNEAFLVIATKPPGVGVIIDGKKTSLVTPVRQPYAVHPGKHMVTFEMTDGQKYSFEVSVSPGETKKLVKQLR